MLCRLCSNTKFYEIVTNCDHIYCALRICALLYIAVINAVKTPFEGVFCFLPGTKSSLGVCEKC